jgi:4-amino-4-deoxy-L-arabinose transferase-like glycosyltransferase
MCPAILAKGFGALFIPAAVFLLYFLITGEWDRLRRFPLVSVLWVVAAISFPWHHAMIVRHGDAFFQEYIVHHHFKRAAEGVHGERGTFAYYLNQMLFGLLPLWRHWWRRCQRDCAGCLLRAPKAMKTACCC